MTEFNYNESYEFLASRFYTESGYMAPGKSVAPEMVYTDEEDKERQVLWKELMKERTREAWTLWQQAHGYLRVGRND